MRGLVRVPCRRDRVHRSRHNLARIGGSKIRDRQTTEAGYHQDRHHGPDGGGRGYALDQPVHRQTYEHPGARASLMRDEVVDQRHDLRAVTLANPARVEQQDRAREAVPHGPPRAIRSSPRLAIRADSARRSASAVRPAGVSLYG